MKLRNDDFFLCPSMAETTFLPLPLMRHILQIPFPMLSGYRHKSYSEIILFFDFYFVCIVHSSQDRLNNSAGYAGLFRLMEIDDSFFSAGSVYSLYDADGFEPVFTSNQWCVIPDEIFELEFKKVPSCIYGGEEPLVFFLP